MSKIKEGLKCKKRKTLLESYVPKTTTTAFKQAFQSLQSLHICGRQGGQLHRRAFLLL